MKPAALLLLLLATPLVAADPPGRWRVSVLRVDNGMAVATAYAPNAKWDVELGVAEQHFTSAYTVFTFGPPPFGVLPATTFKGYTVHPLDLCVTRRFMTGQRISPYVRAGARYVDAPDDPPNAQPAVPAPPPGFVLASPGFHLADRASAQAGAGVRVRLTSRTALRVEVDHLMRSHGAQFDPLTRMAAGLSWHF